MSPQLCASQRHFIAGPSGNLEVLMNCPKLPRDTFIPFGVICHPHPLYGGTMDNKIVYIIAQTFNLLGAGAVRFNFRGTGGSEGEFDYGEGETQDLYAVVDWLTTEYAVKELWLAGYSFGGYVALHAHRHLKPRRLLLIAPAIERAEEAEPLLVETSTLIIQGEKDEVVLPETVLKWAQNQVYKPQIQVIPSSDHFFHRQLNEIREVIIHSW